MRTTQTINRLTGRPGAVLLSLLAAALLAACGEEDHSGYLGGPTVVAGVPQARTLSGERLTVDPDALMGAQDLCYADGGMILVGLKRSAGEECFCVVSPQSGTANRILRSGRGPGERIFASYAGYRDGLLDVADAAVFKLATYNVAELVAGANGLVREQEIPRFALNPHRVGENLLCHVLIPDNTMRLYDGQGGLLASYDRMGPMDESFTQQKQGWLQSSDALKPDGTRLAMCLFNLDRINVLDLRGKGSFSIVTDKAWKGKDDRAEVLRQIEEHDRRNYYRKAQATDRHIYARYIYPEGHVEIRVFDWNGKMSARYVFEEPLASFCVTEDDSILYGLTEEEEIWQYKLK